MCGSTVTFPNVAVLPHVLRYQAHEQRGLTMEKYALNQAKVYFRNMVAADPELTPGGPTIINTESSLHDPGRLFFDLDDGTRIELVIRRYER